MKHHFESVITFDLRLGTNAYLVYFSSTKLITECTLKRAVSKKFHHTGYNIRPMTVFTNGLNKKFARHQQRVNWTLFPLYHNIAHLLNLQQYQVFYVNISDLDAFQKKYYYRFLGNKITNVIFISEWHRRTAIIRQNMLSNV